MFLASDAINNLNIKVSPETSLIEITNILDNFQDFNQINQELLVVKNSQVLGIVKLCQIFTLIKSGIELEKVTIAEVMKPAITLQ